MLDNPASDNPNENDKPSAPGEGVIQSVLLEVCAEAGYGDLRTYGVQAAVKDHAASCAIAERNRILDAARQLHNVGLLTLHNLTIRAREGGGENAR